ncbi:YjbE family putative metal transport protein [Phenylobacterium sp.]|uniref:YjbE family putative metal transport protein n=1 Tax=Phenylobacterium sp. TaxID=1871053 RepID=UPI00374D9DEC
MSHLVSAGAFAAFFQVVLIDLALAGDNAVAVGMAAAGLPERQRRKAIVLGLGAAVVMLIGFALITTQLLRVVGLLLAGGLLLLWVGWRMWRDLRDHGEEHAEGEEALGDATGVDIAAKPRRRPKPTTLRTALIQILMADLAMSLDNVLAVAGAARQHPWVLVGGLTLSITLTGFAASFIAKLLNRFRWIGYIGLAMIIFVACHMIWDGTRTVFIDTGKTRAYNQAMPGSLDIRPDEVAKRKKP